MDIRIELEENLSAALNRAIAAGNDLSEPMKDIADHLAMTSKRRFEDEEGPSGAAWKQSQRAREEGGRTLNLSGDLKNSIRPDWGRDFAAAGPERSGGAGVYAAIHQFGGTIVPKTKKALSFGGRLFAKVVMPARPYLGFDDRNRSYVTDALRKHLGKALGGAAS